MIEPDAMGTGSALISRRAAVRGLMRSVLAFGGLAVAGPTELRAPPSLPRVRAPSGAAMLSTLRGGHPRLLLLPADGARSYAEALTAAGRRMLGEAPVERTLDRRGTILAVSRWVVQRVYTLELLFLLDGDPRRAERAAAALESALGTDFGLGETAGLTRIAVLLSPGGMPPPEGDPAALEAWARTGAWRG
jgi:hypothetical protein